MIVSSPQSGSPLYLRALLDELRASASFETLDSHIRNYIQCNDIPELFDRILARWESDYETPQNPRLIRDTLALLYCSRRGLSEAELIRLLKCNTALDWSRAMFAMRESLINNAGLYNLYHSHLEKVRIISFIHSCLPNFKEMLVLYALVNLIISIINVAELTISFCNRRYKEDTFQAKKQRKLFTKDLQCFLRHTQVPCNA